MINRDFFHLNQTIYLLIKFLKIPPELVAKSSIDYDTFYVLSDQKTGGLDILVKDKPTNGTSAAPLISVSIYLRLLSE